MLTDFVHIDNGLLFVLVYIVVANLLWIDSKHGLVGLRNVDVGDDSVVVACVTV